MRSITKPDMTLYINNKQNMLLHQIFRNILLGKDIKSVIIGNIDIEVDASENVGYVDFYIDGDFKATDDEPPFVWNWNEISLGRHNIKVIADNAGYHASDEIEVLKFF